MIPGINKRVLNFYDLMLYVALVRKHSRLMVLLMAMCLLGGLAIFSYSRQVFYSKSLIRVDALGLPLDTDKLYHDGNIMAIIGELKGPELMKRTAARMGIYGDPGKIERDYLRNYKFDITNTGNLYLEVWAYSPDWPVQWPQLLIEEFMKLRAERREEYHLAIMKSYGEELKQLNQRIKDDQDKSSQFADQANSTRAYIEAERLRNVPVEIVQTKQRLDQLESIRKELENPDLDTVARLSLMASADAESPVQIGQSFGAVPGNGSVQVNGVPVSGTAAQEAEQDEDSVVKDSVVVPGLVAEIMEWQGLEKRERELLKEESELSRVYRSGNVKMVAVQKELEQVEHNLNVDYEVSRDRLDLILRGLHEHYDDLQSRLPEYESVNRKYERIKQMSKLHEAGELSWMDIYGDAAKTITEVEYTMDKERVNLRYDHLDAWKPDPVAPQKGKIMLMAMMAGMVMALAIPFLIEYLDYTMSNLEEVESTFQMRGLGIIPQLPHQTDRPLLMDVASDSDERNLIENFRVVRTNLLAMGALTKPAHVTMVTSAVPKEGKTVIASNLSISFSQTGARTLLMDTDLRRGRLHRLFGLRKSPGLSDFLLSKVPLDEVIRPSGKPNLSIMSAGQHLDSGTELLGSPAFAELMALLRSQYDRIILDTPPVLGLSEASILQNLVDGVLFVIWSGRTPIRNMKTAIDILSSNGANFYGFILNRLDLSTTTNYYQYYYYSSDYYHSYHALENA